MTEQFFPLALDPDGPVYAIETHPYAFGQPYVFIGGSFQIIGGVPAHNVAQYYPYQKIIFPNWTPNLDGPVYALKMIGDYVYVGGSFTTIDNIQDRYLAKISISRTYSADYTNPNPPTGPVYAMYYNDPTYSLFIGGVFTYMGTQVRNHIAQINPGTDLLTSWNPNVNGNVRVIAGVAPASSHNFEYRTWQWSLYVTRNNCSFKYSLYRRRF